MMNDKSTPKRHIGPAMHWAKPKTDKDSSAGRGNREIKIELPDVAGDSDRTAYVPNERATSDGARTAGSPSQGDDLTSHPRQNPAEPAETSTTDAWWRRGTEHSEGGGSAWNEYSTPQTRGGKERFSGPERSVDEALTTYNYGSDDYESSVADIYQRETAQHNASSFDGAPRASSYDDQTVWWQYLLPVAVVGLVIFLALLTLIT